MKLIAFLFFFCLSALPSLAADKDDFYFLGYGGMRLSSKYQFGAGLGYLPVDSVGIGVLYDQTADSVMGSFETRIFLEPFEVALSIGLESGVIEGASVEQDAVAVFGLAGDYLVAITSSLAARIMFRWQLPQEGKGNVFAGVGFRVLF